MQNLIFNTPRQALNKAFLKRKPCRADIDIFYSHLSQLIYNINELESEEFHKNLISNFLHKAYYAPQFFINTKAHADLVIHNGSSAKTSVGVIIETKKPSNKTEMLTFDNHNIKALHELLLYYLRERITQQNIEIKNLIITNIYEWFVFDANVFEKLFAQNKALVQQFEDFEQKRLSGHTTDFFYNHIAKPFIAQLEQEIECTYFDIRDSKTDIQLIHLFKIFSPEHLLKQAFINDSNSLDKQFYEELLHIMGLTEVKSGNKLLIERQPVGKRCFGSILENAILQLEGLKKIPQLGDPSRFGNNISEQRLNIAIELTITWINRILFLKLLEAQLISYHNDNKAFGFLHSKLIPDYSHLNNILFFQVLARKQHERQAELCEPFQHVPYLNSTLFEPTELEHQTIFIGNLLNYKTLPIYSATVLKDSQGKKYVGELDALQYLFLFLDAYDFTSEGKEAIQEHNKRLINASVLGRIFEKINGYKEGSFFTPGFITMYMSRETIRKAVVQKFNEVKGWHCKDLADLYNKIDDKKEANQIVNRLKICDPAVGSGHFLVSVLNELIVIKSKLKILFDAEQERLLRDHRVRIEHDELIVEYENGDLFEYKASSIGDKLRVQKALFHEKQTIIENCLFGVDINPNSVKICQLRLWIELLKHAYYKAKNELETLPNIDINIKCGNALVSRFDIKADIKNVLQTNGWSIEAYRQAVQTYRNAEMRHKKHEMETFIANIKQAFKTEISKNDPKVIRFDRVKAEIRSLKEQREISLLADEKLQQQAVAAKKQKLARLMLEAQKLQTEINDIKNNRIYTNAFEWRFEFPEVLNDDGDFIGFDVIIGNPPYIAHDLIKYSSFLKMHYSCFEPFADLYCYFFELGLNILQKNGLLSFITSNSFLKAKYGQPLRNLFNQHGQFYQLINIEGTQIFETATVNTVIGHFAKNQYELITQIVNHHYELKIPFEEFINNNKTYYQFSDFSSESWSLAEPSIMALSQKIATKGQTLEQLGAKIKLGLGTGYNEAFVISEKQANQFIQQDKRNKDIIKPVLRGKDIARYYFQQQKFILLTKNGINVEQDYPIIYNYLDGFGTTFKNRGAKGKHWTNLRSCSFFDDFQKPKIIWIELTDKNKFAICYEEMYLLNSAYFLLPPANVNMNYLLGILNSKLINFYLKLLANTSGTGTTRWIKAYVKDLPIIIKQNNELIQLVEQVIQDKKYNVDTTALETQIDQIIYALYELTDKEIAIVEKS